MDDIIQIFSELQQDAVIWKGKKIWRNATDPDEQAAAMGALTTMLLCIGNEIKRTAYIKQLANAVANDAQDLQDEIKRLEKLLVVKQKALDKLLAKPEVSLAWDTDCSNLKAQLEECRSQIATHRNQLPAPLPEKSLAKHLAAELRRRNEEAEKKVMNAKLEKEIASAEDAGMPEDFKGSMQDVYDALKYGIYVHDNVYYSRGGRGGDYPISNFTMKIIYHIPTNDDTSFRLIAVRNVYGFETVININTDDFVSVGSFKKILARRGDYVFKGGDPDLTRLQEFLQKDETSAQRIEVLGWNKTYKFWAWSNGLTVMNEDATTTFLPVDEHGIVEYMDKRYFIPACSMMYSHKEGMFVNEKKFVYCPPQPGLHFEDWAKTMYLAYGKKSIAAMLWYISALFRDVIMKKVRRLPLLNLFGPPGAGKGELYDSIMHLFGYKQDQIMLSGASTVVGFMRKFAQFNNAVVGLDEYKNNLQQKIIESLKNLYDGIGYERGKMTNDFATESTPVNSSCILLGQDMPTIEPALFMRCILLSFQEGKFTNEQRVNYKKLKDDFEPHGLSAITAHMLQFRQAFEERFKEDYSVIFKQTVKDVANVEVDDRMIMNISILLTCMHLTKDRLEFPFTYHEAKAWLIDNMMQQHTILAGNNDLAKFWSIVESLFIHDQIKENTDFMLQDGYLFIIIGQVQPLYQKEMIDRRDMNYLAKPTLMHYLEMDKNVFCGNVKKRFPDGSNNWCFKMKYANLGINLIRVKKNAFESIEQHRISVAAKYKEMGVDDGEDSGSSQDDGMPFPLAK